MTKTLAQICTDRHHELFISAGISRAVYHHPTNSNYVVKIPRRHKKYQEREIRWWHKLIKAGLGDWVPNYIVASDTVTVVEALRHRPNPYGALQVPVIAMLENFTNDAHYQNVMVSTTKKIKLADLGHEDWSNKAFKEFCAELQKYDCKTGYHKK